MVNKRKISIIVPVYNVAPYLHQCMDSLVNQTYPHIEIVCVDDGSTDESGTILEEYAARDDRVKVIHQKNAGVAAARNKALECAVGEGILFVDGDDWIEPDTVSVAMDYDTELVMWAYMREFPDHSAPRQVFQENALFQETGCKDLQRRMIGLNGKELSHPESADSLSTVWAKLYRRSIIEQHCIRFTDLQRIGTYEDGLFNLQYLLHTTSAVFINACLYHYRKNTGMTSKYRESLRQQWKNLFFDIRSYISETEKENAVLLQSLNNRISLSVIGLGLNALSNSRKKEILSEIREILSDPEYRAAIRTLPMRYFPPHWWVFFVCCKLRFAVGVYMLLKCMERMK